jgi:hypothetical protein
LLPLFEAVVNSIQAVDDLAEPGVEIDPGMTCIEIRIIRGPQASLPLGFDPHLEPVTGFVVTDNGVGFDERNMKSFETLDSEYKSAKGCRGAGEGDQGRPARQVRPRRRDPQPDHADAINQRRCRGDREQPVGHR